MEATLAWREVPLRPTPPRLYGASLTATPRGLLLFGGSSPEGTFSSQLYLIDTSLATCTHLRPDGQTPGERHFHAAVFHDGYLYIHGGKSNGYHNDLHCYSLESNTWKTIVPAKSGPLPGSPLARFGHTAVVIDAAMYVFGGYDQHGWMLADLFRFDLVNAQWLKVPPSQAPPSGLERMHHAAVAYARTMLVVGGKGDKDAALSDLVEYHVDSKAWTRLVCTGASPARHGHTAVLMPSVSSLATSSDSMSVTLLVFGGTDGQKHFAQLHALDLRTRQWRLMDVAGSQPGARYFHAMCNSAQGVYLFGGKNTHNACFSDLYLLSPSSSTLPSSAPSNPNSNYNSVASQMQMPASGSASSLFQAHALSPVSPPVHPTAPIGATTTTTTTASALAMDASKLLRLKCTLNGEIRVLSTVMAELTYASLTALLATEYGVEPGTLRVQYTDPEGDRVTVRSERDLASALHYVTNNLLRLLLSPVTLSQSPAAASAVGVHHNSSSIEVTSAPPSPQLSTSFEGAGASHSPSPSSSTSRLPAPIPMPMTTARRQEVKWVKGPLLDQGAFGAVYLALDAHTGLPYAVKTLTLAHASQPSAAAALQREIDLLATLSHPHIVRYLGTALIDNALHIFMEFVPGGSLASLLRKFKRLPEPLTARYTAQVLCGLAYLHERGIVHRDIKGANVLVDAQGNLKVADFGAAKQLDLVVRGVGSGNLNVGSGGAGAVNSEACQTVTGTPYYMAPEVIQGARHYGRKADIWSLGALVVEMSTGAPPYADLPPVAALFRIGSDTAMPPLPANLSATAQHFLALCFTRDPRLRPASKKLQEHAFVTSIPLPIMALTQPAEALTFVLQTEAPVARGRAPPLPAMRPSSLSDSSEDSASANGDEEDLRGSLNEQRILQYIQNESSHSIVASHDFLTPKAP